MAETSYPFGTSDVTTELQWSRMARLWQVDGVVGDDPTSSALRVSVTGSTYSVQPGEAWINGFFYQNTAVITGSLTTNAGSSTRYDRIVLRASQAGDSVNVVVVTGGTSPPVLQSDEAGTYDIPLARFGVTAGSNGLSSGTLVDERYFIGKPVAVQSSTSRRPSRRGQVAIEGTASEPVVMVGSGSGWVQVHPTVKPAYQAVPFAPNWQNFGSGFANGGFTKTADGFVVLNGLVRAKAGYTPPERDRVLTLPVGYRPSGQLIFTVPAGVGTANQEVGRLDVKANGDVILGYFNLPAGGWISLDGVAFHAA